MAALANDAAGGGMPHLSWTADSNPMAVRNCLDDVVSGLQPLSLDAEDLGTVQLVLAEVLNNIAEHAYPDGETQGSIRINCQTNQDGLNLHIEDCGKPMPDGKTPVGKQADLNVDFEDLPEGGFGWFLIQNLTKDVVYERQSGKNILTFRLPVGLIA